MKRMAAGLALIGIAILMPANWAIYATDINVSPIRSTVRTGTKETKNSEDALQAHGPKDFGPTIERPLFSIGRRKFVPAPAEPVPVETAVLVRPTPAPDVAIGPEVLPKLLGISIGADIPKALFRADGAEAQWRARSESLAGWLIVAIEKDRVLVERDGQETGILLYPSATTPSRSSSDVQ